MGDLGASVWLPALIGAAGSIGASALAPSNPDYEPTKFTGIGDPQFLMEQTLKGLTSYGRAATDRARQPITLSSSFAQTPEGLTGIDPAFTDRSLLTIPGQNLPDFFPDLGDVWEQSSPSGRPPIRGEQGARRRPADSPILGRAVYRPGYTPPSDPDDGVVRGPRRQRDAGIQAPEDMVVDQLGTGSTAPAESASASAPPSPTSLAPETALVRRLRGSSSPSRSPVADPERAMGATQILLELAAQSRSQPRAA